MPHTKMEDVKDKAEDAKADFREEFDALRTEVSDLLQSLKNKSEAKASTLSETLQNKAGQYQDQAEQKLHDVYEAGNVGLNEVGDHIRKNPVASLLVAFGMGYAISKVLGQGK